MDYALILGVIISISIFGIIVTAVTRYKRCPSDKLLVIYGKTNGGTAKVHYGGGAFIWPIIQSYGFLGGL